VASDDRHPVSRSDTAAFLRRLINEEREAHDLLILATDASSMGWGTWDFEVGETEWDERARQIMGLEDDAQEATSLEAWLELIHPEDRPRVERLLHERISEGREYRFEYRIVLPDGKVRHILATGLFRAAPDGTPRRGTGLVQDVTERKRAREERQRLRLLEAASLAEAAERERISRELHDRVAHGMAVAHQSLELFSALRETDHERAEEKLELAREATRMALDRTRNLSAELKRLRDEELTEGLQAAFEKLADTFAPDGTAMEVSFSGDQSAVAPLVGMQAYLTMREAVRNAVRHSGCSRIAVRLVVEDGELRARVEDDGAGFDPDTAEATPSWGVGLRSMRERAESLGGTLRVDSEPEKGTRVEMRVPLDGIHP
jgi:PAS domain S-box-containing protein